MRKQLGEARIKTDHPHPIDSPDYHTPAGSIEDNNTNPYFIWEIDSYFGGRPYNLLDIGCAGGQFVVDIYNKGLPWFAAGIEGGNIYGMTGSFEPRECETGTLTEPRGAQNWSLYKDKCLFHADVSKPFQITAAGPDGTDQQVFFHIVTAFEFFEHPKPEEISGILKNINKHLHLGGIVCGTINLSPGFHHRCAKPKEWWDNIFIQHGFEVPTETRSYWSFLRGIPRPWPRFGPNGEEIEGWEKYTSVYPFRSTYRTNAEFILHITRNENQCLLDNEVGAHEFNYPFFIIKEKNC